MDFYPEDIVVSVLFEYKEELILNICQRIQEELLSLGAPDAVVAPYDELPAGEGYSATVGIYVEFVY